MGQFWLFWSVWHQVDGPLDSHGTGMVWTQSQPWTSTTPGEGISANHQLFLFEYMKIVSYKSKHYVQKKAASRSPGFAYTRAINVLELWPRRIRNFCDLEGVDGFNNPNGTIAKHINEYLRVCMLCDCMCVCALHDCCYNMCVLCEVHTCVFFHNLSTVKETQVFGFGWGSKQQMQKPTKLQTLKTSSLLISDEINAKNTHSWHSQKR